MAEIKFARGNNKSLYTLPLADGQLILIEDIPEWLFDIADENGNLHRYPVRDQITLDILNAYIQSNDEQLKNLRKDLEDIPTVQVSSVNGKLGDVELNPEDIGLKNVDNTADMDKPVSIPQQEAIDNAYMHSKQYTNDKIAELISDAPNSLDTLNKLAIAIINNESVVAALNETIETKADKTELEGHVDDTTVHITQAERDKWNDQLNNTSIKIPVDPETEPTEVGSVWITTK